MVDSILKAISTIAQPNLRSGMIQSVFGPNLSVTSAAVNNSQALKLSAFYNGVKLIADDIAKLPKGVYKKDGDKRIKATDHPAHNLIAAEPNQNQTSYAYHWLMALSLLTKGNAVAIITPHQASGKPVEFTYVPQHKVQYLKYQGKLFYKIEGKVYPSSQIFHLANTVNDELIGQSVVYYAAQSLGVQLEAQNYAHEVYSNKGLGYGVIETDKDVKPEAKKTLSDAFNARMSQRDVFRVPVLDEGFKYKSIQLNPQETEFLQTHAAGVQDVARWLNLYPHKLKDLSSANFSNVYQMEISHVQDSIMPYVVMFEQEYNRKIFTPTEKASHYTKFNLNALLRANLKDKASYYSVMVHSGVMTRNEVRALEELNPIEGLEEPLTPVNTQTLEQIQKSLKDE